MSDPFAALRKESAAENPPPRFVLELYRRLEREFGTHTPNAQLGGTQPMTGTIPRVHTAVPSLVVPDIDAAVAFYEAAFGAADAERHRLPDGSLVYAAFRLGSARVGVAGEEPPGNRAPHALGGSAVLIDLEVDDADAFVARAVGAGAEVVIPVADYAYGRSGRLADPFGHLWIVTSPREKTP